jgi:predicted ATPase
MAISSDHGFLHWKYQAMILRGWALAELDQIDYGLNQIRAGLDGYEAMESWLGCSWFRSLLAGVYAKAGRPDAALRALDDALTIAKRTGERFYLAEIYRLQGEIALKNRSPEAPSAAEACYKRSLEVCHSQEAISWKLRTTVDLARLWHDVGKRQDAANLLAPVCRRLEQGLDTWDVKEAAQIMTKLEAG